MSTSMKYDPHKPYNQLPLLPPKKDLEKKAILKKAIAAGRALAELKGIQPYTKGQFLVDAGIAERQTAAEYLKELEKTGVLKSHKVGKENLYLNIQLYRLLSQ